MALTICLQLFYYFQNRRYAMLHFDPGDLEELIDKIIIEGEVGQGVKV